MKKLKLIFLFILIAHSTFGQDDIHTSASVQIQEMINFYNKREIPKYVDYLLPVYYGNENKYKEQFSKMWEKVLKKDTSKIKVIELLKLAKSENQYQALFHINFRNGKSYIIGISDNEGKNWKFTQAMNENIKFDQILEKIPTLNHSFAKNIDIKFGKRISYKIGKIISPFNYTDINGNKISSKTLKGKIIVLNFWGRWCAPCVKEIPQLNELVEKYNNDKVKFIAPAIGTTKETLINNFLPKHPFLYQIVVIDGNDYVISSFPTHVIINKKNEVIEIIKGYSEENIQKLKNIINENL
jgi:thiol-disulfide isomerase/thioredoxin